MTINISKDEDGYGVRPKVSDSKSEDYITAGDGEAKDSKHLDNRLMSASKFGQSAEAIGMSIGPIKDRYIDCVKAIGILPAERFAADKDLPGDVLGKLLIGGEVGDGDGFRQAIAGDCMSREDMFAELNIDDRNGCCLSSGEIGLVTSLSGAGVSSTVGSGVVAATACCCKLVYDDKDVVSTLCYVVRFDGVCFTCAVVRKGFPLGLVL